MFIKPLKAPTEIANDLANAAKLEQRRADKERRAAMHKAAAAGAGGEGGSGAGEAEGDEGEELSEDEEDEVEGEEDDLLSAEVEGEVKEGDLAAAA